MWKRAKNEGKKDINNKTNTNDKNKSKYIYHPINLNKLNSVNNKCSIMNFKNLVCILFTKDTVT